MKRTPLKRKRPLRQKLPDGPARRGENRECSVCGREFYVSPLEIRRGGRYCTRTCMGKDYAAQAALKKPRILCSVCSRLLANPGPPSQRRKTCSPACANEAKRRAKAADRNPNFKGDEAAKIRWRSQAATACAVCGGDDRLALHHVVYRQTVIRAGGDPYDPRDSLTACTHCHTGHHHGQRSRIELRLLRDENYEFAFELLGPAAFDYLRRHYVGEDPRLTVNLAALSELSVAA